MRRTERDWPSCCSKPSSLHTGLPEWVYELGLEGDWRYVGPTSISSIYLGFAEFRAVFAGTAPPFLSVVP